MKITICGSMAMIDQMHDIGSQLETLGHQVKIPKIEIKDLSGNSLSQKEYDAVRKNATAADTWIWEINREAMRDHFVKITWSDAILVPNFEKNSIPGYIGPNTLMEMGLALFLNKKIFLLNPIPDIQSKEEILGINPIILNGRLELIA
jgi:hypothetical protein